MSRALLGLIVVLCACSATRAAPITYSFSGSLDRQSVASGTVPHAQGGLNFSGTFFYDPDLPTSTLKNQSNASGQSIANYEEGAAGITPGTHFGMTVTVGGETFTTTHNTQWDQLTVSSGKSLFNLSAAFVLFTGPSGDRVSLSIGFTSPDTQVHSSVAPPPNLDGFTLAGFGLTRDRWGQSGQLSSFQLASPVAVPEPASLLVYALGCIGFAVTRRVASVRAKG